MITNCNIMGAAIALVISGAISKENATMQVEQISSKLHLHEDVELRQQLDVMLQCVELFSAQEKAINDWRNEA